MRVYQCLTLRQSAINIDHGVKINAFNYSYTQALLIRLTFTTTPTISHFNINFQSLEDNPFDYDYYYYYEVNRGREDVDCFADKLVFTDGINTFSPIYSGYCSSYSTQQVIVQLDSRDYLSFIQLGFATASDGVYPALSIYHQL